MKDLCIQKRDAKKSWTISAVIGVFAFATSLFASSSPAEAVVLDAVLNEQVVMIPASFDSRSIELETTIFKPPGEGPFPVVVMNHGKALGNPRNQNRDRFIVLSREFVKRGYAVIIPMRKGFSKSSGEYVDRGCDMTAHGQSQADDLQAALEYLRGQPWADAGRVVVAGQSYGGLTALAFGTRQYPGVKGLINFAGGLKMHGGDCRWQQSLVQAFASYGAKSTLPSLWFYGENDNHFGPDLAARLHNAYIQAGGNARLVAYGPFKKDAHGMSASRDGVKIWWPETEKFLKELGMPTDTVLALDTDVKVPQIEYAAIDNVDAIPYLKGSAREQYRVFLGKSYPRAFAVSPTGAWSWAEDGDDPVEQALQDCQKNSNQPCRLYAVDNHVVWTDESLPTRIASPASPQTSALTGP
ncbi:MAG TPA: CocE/NonD family hydrolase [Noviherbaspirillum sp.]|uniref:dienelactone hydrolase family protein n=1 Tax=Noviherbaspirillum sp. TaxID=1926288 RepID=UPI002D435EBF|nr:CocE/NonD family hydrolase [Noviherbaspirillum sp.]HYD96308.1 CocE/NonD family hydrolase [Noviherbaspirillum sp.]